MLNASGKRKQATLDIFCKKRHFAVENESSHVSPQQSSNGGDQCGTKPPIPLVSVSSPTHSTHPSSLNSLPHILPTVTKSSPQESVLFDIGLTDFKNVQKLTTNEKMNLLTNTFIPAKNWAPPLRNCGNKN